MFLQEFCSIRYGNYLLDMQRVELSLDGLTTALTSSEFSMMRALMRAPGKVLPREELQGMNTNDCKVTSSRTVDENIRKLRKKIEAIGGSPHALQCIRGVGYKFD